MAAADTPDVVLEPVKRSRIYEHIVEQIHALIREGRWAPGDQIPPERELAERLGAGAHSSAGLWTVSPEDFASRLRDLVGRITGLS